MKAYSMDLRERVWRACQCGSMSQPEVAEEFGVSPSFITKLLRRYREAGNLAAKPRGGNRRPDLGRRDLVALRRLVRERPDATLAELCRLLRGRRGVAVRVWTVCRALARLRLPLKKSRRTTPSATRRVSAACAGPTPAN